MIKWNSCIIENCNNIYVKIYKDNKYLNVESMYRFQQRCRFELEILRFQDIVFKRN